MLSDSFLQSRYLKRLERLIELAEQEVVRNKWQPEFRALSSIYHRQFNLVRSAFLGRYDRNLVQAFRRLQELGKVEIIASAATHGYLPLLSVNPSAVRSQVAVGVSHYAATFGRKPSGFWLPECGYYPGVDQVLSDRGIRFTIVETHGITRAQPRPRYGVHAPLRCPSGLAAFGRDPESSKQVWSAVHGYPGDYDYREFYRDVAPDLDADSLQRYVHRDGLRIDTGIKYYRITGKTENKQVYVPEAAARKIEIHAEHFVLSREKQFGYLASIMDRKPIVVAPYDAELFGHWWYEGTVWLDRVIRKIARDESAIRLVTLSEYLKEYPAIQSAAPPLSSWGRNGFNETWLGPDNQWIYPHLHRAARVMEQLEKNSSGGDRLKARALHQAKRELLLAEASDWAFMMSSRTMLEYANTRTKTHLLNFDRLSHQIANQTIDEPWLADLEVRGCIFSADVLSSGTEMPTVVASG